MTGCEGMSKIMRCPIPAMKPLKPEVLGHKIALMTKIRVENNDRSAQTTASPTAAPIAVASADGAAAGTAGEPSR